jgi:hypothetical protein
MPLWVVKLDALRISMHRAEEDPEESLLTLWTQMIEAYAPYKVVGPVFYMVRRSRRGNCGAASLLGFCRGFVGTLDDVTQFEVKNLRDA